MEMLQYSVTVSRFLLLMHQGWIQIWWENWVTGHTWIVPAATRWHSPSPRLFKLSLCPFLVLITRKCIRGEVADLKARILAQEVRKWHPMGRRGKGRNLKNGTYHIHTFNLLPLEEKKSPEEEEDVSAMFTRTPRPQSGWSAVPGHHGSHISTQMN